MWVARRELDAKTTASASKLSAPACKCPTGSQAQGLPYTHHHTQPAGVCLCA